MHHHASCRSLQALPRILGGESVIAGAETGSGKTWLYILPILTSLLHPPLGTQAVILAPSQELVLQICSIYAVLSGRTDGAMAVVSGSSLNVSRVPDVIVATPGALKNALSRSAVGGVHPHGKLLQHLAAVRMIAIDEADLTLSPTHRIVVDACLERLAALQPEATATTNPTVTASADGAATEVSIEAQASAATKAPRSKRSPFQFIIGGATVATSDHLDASNKQAVGFAKWVQEHLPHASFVRSAGYRRVPAQVRFLEAVIDTALLQAMKQRDDQARYKTLGEVAEEAKLRALVKYVRTCKHGKPAPAALALAPSAPALSPASLEVDLTVAPIVVEDDASAENTCGIVVFANDATTVEALHAHLTADGVFRDAIPWLLLGVLLVQCSNFFALGPCCF